MPLKEDAFLSASRKESEHEFEEGYSYDCLPDSYDKIYEYRKSCGSGPETLSRIYAEQAIWERPQVHIVPGHEYADDWEKLRQKKEETWQRVKEDDDHVLYARVKFVKPMTVGDLEPKDWESMSQSEEDAAYFKSQYPADTAITLIMYDPFSYSVELKNYQVKKGDSVSPYQTMPKNILVVQ